MHKDVKEALRHAPNLVAADGGAHVLLDMGLMPRAVIGDMDSLDAAARARLGAARLHPISEQETTDFDKCLRSIAAPLILGVGFGGKRLDHQLAALSALLAHPGQRCILLVEDEVVFLAPRRLALELAAGTRVSLYPLRAVRASASGLRWPLAGLDLAPGGRIGTSNEALGGAVVIETEAAGLLILLPRDCLGVAMAALLGAQ